MKTLTKTLFASLLTAAFLTSTVAGTFAADPGRKVREDKTPLTFNKIEVTGNVKLVLSQKDRERIAVYGDYNTSKTSIKRKGYTLIINSTENEPVTIVVSVKDLQRIDASNNVKVETTGKFNLKYLQIFLQDEAHATINANAMSLYTVLKDNADLRLSGSSEEHTLVKNKMSKLDMDKFAALKTTTSYFELSIAANKPETK